MAILVAGTLGALLGAWAFPAIVQRRNADAGVEAPR
jgi:hypothetical protein